MMEGKYSFRMFIYFLMLAVCPSDSNAQSPENEYFFNGIPGLAKYVPAGVNENVNVTCLVQVIDSDNFPQRVSVETQWQLLTDTMDFLTFSQDTKIAINHSYISVSGNYSQVLIISNFTQEMDRLTIGCRGNISSDELGMITVGLPVAPTFLPADLIYDVVENETFSINDIRAPSNNPFPPDILGTIWFINNESLSDNANIETGEFNITIKSVTRNYSGSVFTFQSSEPSHSISFSLNVLYPPKVEFYNMSYVYTSVGDNVILYAVFNITGNPAPLSTWRRNEIILSSSDKYSFTIPGQISVTNLTVEDFNLYVFTVSNTIGNDIIVEISLRETEPRFKSAYVNNIENNGGLFLTWNLIHTGYEKNIDQIPITATCKNINTTENGLPYYYNCSSDCIDNNLMGSGYIEGPVYAGVSYQCILTTANSNGSNLYTTEVIIPINGIPSPPVITLVDATGDIIIVVWSQYSGDNSTFLFVVMVINDDDDVIVHNMNYTGLSYRNITIAVPIAGNYSVNVTSRNKFGISDGSSAQIELNSSRASVKSFAVLITIGVILSALFTQL